MKEVRLHFMKGGRVRILAEGANGKGTADFTLGLANSLGSIVERHRGPTYEHVHEKPTQVQTREGT